MKKNSVNLFTKNRYLFFLLNKTKNNIGLEDEYKTIFVPKPTLVCEIKIIVNDSNYFLG